MTHVLSAESVDLLRRLYLEGVPLREIAAQVGCSIANASARAHKMGLPKRLRSSGDLPHRVIVDAYKTGLGSKAIGSKLGVHPSLVIAIVKSRGERLHPQGGQIHCDKRAECVRMFRQGMFHREIAQRLGMTKAQVLHRVQSVLGKGTVADGGRRRGARHRMALASKATA